MCVVDSMRFPYIDGTGSTISTSTDTLNNTVYERSLQHHLLGPAAPALSRRARRAAAERRGHRHDDAAARSPLRLHRADRGPPDSLGDTANYGYLLPGHQLERDQQSTFNATNYMYHTLGLPNDSAENWDYLVFNDRDFSSVAELLLVPGCPPGLFTKQFVEVAPSQMNAANIFATVTPIITPTFASLKQCGGGHAAGGRRRLAPGPPSRHSDRSRLPSPRRPCRSCRSRRPRLSSRRLAGIDAGPALPARTLR